MEHKTLKEVIDDAAKNKAGQGGPKFVDGSLIQVPLELLDPNPWQPRSSMDTAELESLMASLEAQGLIQPIAVRPKDGRFITVAGHRRAEGFRRLLAKTGNPKWSTIPGQVKLALDDSQLAAQAYMENVSRAALTLLDEAMALEKMLEAKLADSTESLAALTQQSVQRIRRLRRLSAAPSIIRQAISTGVRVVVGKDETGKEQVEVRRLELMDSIAFLRLFEHHAAAHPLARAEERTEAVLRRALAGNWSKQRVETYVDQVLAGRAPDPDSAPTAAPEAALYQVTPRRFVVDCVRLKAATAAQVQALRAALDDLLAKSATDAQAGAITGDSPPR